MDISTSFNVLRALPISEDEPRREIAVLLSAEAIALALERGADVVLLDERRGRQRAEDLGLTFICGSTRAGRSDLRGGSCRFAGGRHEGRPS